MHCPVCQSDQIEENINHFEYFGKPYTLFACKNCDSWFYHPYPSPDYKEDLNTEISLRHYLETCAGIEPIATIAENFFTNYTSSSTGGLEIGAGFGFGSHYLEVMHNQRMTAFEPSNYGVKGKELLGLNIINDYFRNDKNGKFDYCISTEVIEHIENPVSFVSEIIECLNPNGKLLLSTPDKNAIHLGSRDPIDLALLSPGMHTILFSEQSLRKMLMLAGFSHVLIFKQASTLYAIAGNEPLKEKPLFETDFGKLMTYYKTLYQIAPPGSPLQKGIFYRLFRLYVDFGIYKDAVELLKSNPKFYVLSKEEIEEMKSEKDLTKFYCLTDSIVYFYCGILYLNYLKNFEKAAHLFLLSFLACEKRISLVPHFAIVDVDIIWQAKLHEGIAYEYLGNKKDAINCYLELLLFSPDSQSVPAVKETVYAEAKSRMKHILDSF